MVSVHVRNKLEALQRAERIKVVRLDERPEGVIAIPQKDASPTSVVAVDFNGDGKLDLVMAGFVDSAPLPARLTATSILP